MHFIITGTSQHFGRLVINVNQNNIGLFHQGGYINIRIEQQNDKANLVFLYEVSSTFPIAVIQLVEFHEI